MFISRSSITNTQSFGNAVFDSIEITNGSVALDVYDTSSNSIFRINTAGGGTVTASNLNVTGSFSAGSYPSISFDDGSAAAPPLNFSSSATTGMYYTGIGPSSDELSFVSNGLDMIKMNNTTGITVTREISMTDVNGTGNIKINGLTDSDSNIAIGYTAGNALVSGNALKNILLGYNAGLLSTTGDSNIAIGTDVMSLGITTGSNNICVGTSAGSNLTSGSDNVLIGNGAEPSSGTVSDKLIVKNATNTLIDGDFSAKSLFFDAGLSNPVRVDSGTTVTISASDYAIRCTNNAGTITVNLPAITAGQTRTLIIINASTSSQDVTIDSSGSSTTIDDASTTTLVLSNEHDRVVFVSNGVASGIWYTI